MMAIFFGNKWLQVACSEIVILVSVSDVKVCLVSMSVMEVLQYRTRIKFLLSFYVIQGLSISTANLGGKLFLVENLLV